MRVQGRERQGGEAQGQDRGKRCERGVQEAAARRRGEVRAGLQELRPVHEGAQGQEHGRLGRRRLGG